MYFISTQHEVGFCNLFLEINRVELSNVFEYQPRAVKMLEKLVALFANNSCSACELQ
jgi:hypothetical protein